MSMDPRWMWAQHAVNRYLRMDPEWAADLRLLAGHRVLLRLRNVSLPPVHIWFTEDEGLVFRARCEEPPDVEVAVRPLDLCFFLFERKSLLQNMECKGDVRVLQKIQQAFSRHDPDWQEPLSRWLGDDFVHYLERSMSVVGERVRESRGHVLRDAGEYLQYEKRLLASAAEVNRFCADVDRLRADTDRLEQRVRRFEERRTDDGEGQA